MLSLAFGAVHYFRNLKFITLPPGNTVTIDLRVLGFAALVSVVNVLLFGLVPALRTSRLDPAQTLRESGPGARGGAGIRRIGQLLVVTEVALSVILLAGAAMLITSVERLTSVPLGYHTGHILTGYINLPPLTYPKLAQQAPFCEKLVSQLKVHAGVEAAAITTNLPPNPGIPTYLTIQGRPAFSKDATRDVIVGKITPDYFRLLDIPLLRGRFFAESDVEKSLPVAIINELLVKKYFPGEDPIGKQIKTGEADSDDPWITIVGVVSDERRVSALEDMGYDAPLLLFRPISQSAATVVGVMVRVAGDAATFTPELRDEISALDRNVPLFRVFTLEGRLKFFHAQPEFRADLLGLFSGIALFLAAIGIYGVLSQSVAQRTAEIGIRVAIGAKLGDVLRIILGEGAWLVVSGLVAGIAGSVALSRLIRSLLYETSPLDPTLYVLVSAILAGVALVACWVPARRAARVDPVEALRCE